MEVLGSDLGAGTAAILMAFSGGVPVPTGKYWDSSRSLVSKSVTVHHSWIILLFSAVW
jgi:hypothetical protein